MDIAINWKKNILYVLAWLALIAVFVGAFYLNRLGKTQATYNGTVASCYSIFGGRGGIIEKAHVTLENGKKIKIISNSCCKGKQILVAKKRGLLFFNTIYVRQKA